MKHEYRNRHSGWVVAFAAAWPTSQWCPNPELAFAAFLYVVGCWVWLLIDFVRWVRRRIELANRVEDITRAAQRKRPT